jgi:hypothetical protein
MAAAEAVLPQQQKTHARTLDFMVDAVSAATPTARRVCAQEAPQNDYAPGDYTAMDVLTAAVAAAPGAQCRFCQQPIVGVPFNPRHAIRMCQSPALAQMAVPHTKQPSSGGDQSMPDDDGDDSDQDASLTAVKLWYADDAYHDGHCWMMWTIARFGDDMPLTVTLLKQLPHWAPSSARAELQAYFAGVMEQRRAYFAHPHIPVVDVPLIPHDTSALSAGGEPVEEAVRAAQAIMNAPGEYDTPVPQWPVVTPEMFYAAAAAAEATGTVNSVPAALHALYESALPVQQQYSGGERDLFIE